MSEYPLCVDCKHYHLTPPEEFKNPSEGEHHWCNRPLDVVTGERFWKNCYSYRQYAGPSYDGTMNEGCSMQGKFFERRSEGKA